MIKTSKDLMEWLGLKVGDRIKVNFTSNMFKEDLMYEVVDDKISVNQIHLKAVNTNDFIMIDLHYLVNIDFKLLPTPKTIGDLKCDVDIKCEECPLRYIMCEGCAEDSLYEVLESTTKYDVFDQEIYDLIKTRLDKEVVGK